MNVLLSFFVGVLIGWLIEWVIDWMYWRRLNGDLRSRLQAREDELRQLHNGFTNGSHSAGNVMELRQELAKAHAEAEHYRINLDEAQAKLSRLETALASRPGEKIIERVVVHDNLQEIHGIGPVYEKRLHNAHIFSFTDLAALSPERIEQIIEPEGLQRQRINVASWISEAKKLAQ